MAGCNRSKLELYQNAIVKSRIDINTYNRLLVIPSEGCSGCISSATAFVINDLKYEDSTLVVYTDIKDLKFFKLNVGSVLEDYNFVILDLDNTFSTPSIKSIYPQFWKISDGFVVSVYSF